MEYAAHLLIFLGIYAIVGWGLSFIVGYCGLLNLAHASYVAIGAYTYALITRTMDWGFVPAVAVATALAAILSVALSLPACRVSGDFFVLVSVSVSALTSSILANWSSPGLPPGSWRNLTNGRFGIEDIRPPAIFGSELATAATIAVLVCAVSVAVAVLSWLLIYSPWGRVLRAMRDDEVATRGLGKVVWRLKIQAFAVAGGMAAVGGALYASYVRYIDPGVASLSESLLVLCMVLIGGAGNLRGPLLGAALLLGLPEILRTFAVADAIAASVRLLAYGVLIVAMVHMRPQGLAGSYRVE